MKLRIYSHYNVFIHTLVDVLQLIHAGIEINL